MAGARQVPVVNLAFDDDGESLCYEIGFLRANQDRYSLACSCNAKSGYPATDGDIPYTDVKKTTVEAGEISMADLSLVPELKEGGGLGSKSSIERIIRDYKEKPQLNWGLFGYR